ncbi:hypothetical protein TNIN_460361 [Trichonephila inaurata madagascariensis]|uniref:Uncharacterized protein n=1 Tax=Trichonephila inaurata madagascariensis TaxID=2747483 RepID=A0A8X6Y983_9ARAC|nr:hypothetical protein TNIN_460361 [Trichonephila inaurata madagascariensis]
MEEEDPEMQELIQRQTYLKERLEAAVEKHPNYQHLDGHFLSSFVNHLPEVVPEESKIASGTLSLLSSKICAYFGIETLHESRLYMTT